MDAEEFLKAYPDHDRSRTDAERFAEGLDVMRSVDPAMADAVVGSLASTAPAMAQNIVAHCFGEVYARPTLDSRDRQLATVSILVALGATDAQLRTHMGAALQVGWNSDELVELLMHAAVYCGYPRALNAMTILKETAADA